MVKASQAKNPPRQHAPLTLVHGNQIRPHELGEPRYYSANPEGSRGGSWIADVGRKHGNRSDSLQNFIVWSWLFLSAKTAAPLR